MKSVYLPQKTLKIGMLVRIGHEVMMILSPKGVYQDNFVLVEDIRTGKRHLQNASYLQPVKT